MGINRRDFIKSFLTAGGLTIFGTQTNALAENENPDALDRLGVLVDTTYCVGCRSCEKACNTINDDLPKKPAKYFENESILKTKRRMEADSYTIINRYTKNETGEKPINVKFQCMHCNNPACVSACIVGALSKEKNGAVRYDAWKCIGCRYCMTACPFQVPAYEYSNALDPQVRKCTFCFEKRTSKGELPACVESCPMEVMSFGKRSDLIKIAKERIESNPRKYVSHIYGQHELGGTSWMYLSSVPFDKIGLPTFGYTAAPEYTEPIQHGIFKYFIPPLALYGILGGIMWHLQEKKQTSEIKTTEDENKEENEEGTDHESS